jgi:putative ABC transport system permease protein
MNVAFVLPIAWRALKRNKLRSALTMLGIIIGVGAVIAMTSIGSGAKAQVQAQIASLGQNVLLVWPGSVTQSGVRTGWGSSSALTLDDVAAIQRECPAIDKISPGRNTSTQIVAGNQNWFTQLQGVGVDHLEIRDWPLAEGSFFTDQDVRAAAKVAVIGGTIADQLFGGTDPIGQVIRIKKVPFLVVGVLSRKGQNVMGQDQDDTVLVPYTTAMKRITGSDRLGSITMTAVNADMLEEAQRQVEALLRQRHRIQPDMPDDFTVRNQTEIAEAATATARIMTVLLGSIASVSLIVGGIGIMNIMLVSVTERTREIGIRMAIGAMGRDILVQFLVEAVVLSVIGGIIGIGIGVGTAAVVSKVTGWPTLISYGAVALSFLFAAAVGILFGFYPARKAANLDPIEALRYE